MIIKLLLLLLIFQFACDKQSNPFIGDDPILYLENKRGPTVTFEKQWNVRHILLIPNRIRPDAASEELINEIKNKIENGESFSELASEYSDDPGSKQEGGNLGWAGEGVYDDEFERQKLKFNKDTMRVEYDGKDLELSKRWETSGGSKNFDVHVRVKDKKDVDWIPDRDMKA